MSRDDIVQAVLAAHAAGGLTVKFPDINVMVSADKETAQADITVEAQVPGEQDMMVQEMKFTLRKTDGKWLITRVQTVRMFSGRRGWLYGRNTSVIKGAGQRLCLTKA